ARPAAVGAGLASVRNANLAVRELLAGRRRLRKGPAPKQIAGHEMQCRITRYERARPDLRRVLEGHRSELPAFALCLAAKRGSGVGRDHENGIGLPCLRGSL